MQFGFFDDAQREYVITRPDTPLPWFNYLGSEAYFGLISNTAGGYSFYRDPHFRRLTRYRYNNVPLDHGGRYIYLRDDRTGAFWSPSWQPTRHALERYECRHGLGYTLIDSTLEDIEARIRYFVPLGESLEIWHVTLANRRSESAELSVFSCVEFCLWNALDDASNYQRNLSLGEVEVEDGVIYHKTEYRERRNHFAYFACSEALAGFDTQREAFLGPYRGWDRPQAVETGRSSDSLARGWAPIGSHHVKLALQPGENRQLAFLLGYAENPSDAKFDPPGSGRLNKRTVRQVIDRYLDAANVEAAFAALRGDWEHRLAAFQVNTPDEHTNRMVNIWNPYQCTVTFNLSRSASFFESGITRGMGFRDSNQDLLGFVQLAPDRARGRILDLAATQLEDGSVYHQYQPLTKRGSHEIGRDFNDDPLWLILSAAAYLKETGDFAILDEPAPYDHRQGSEQPLVHHLRACLQHTLDRLGPHGLPLIGRADWNDCLNLNALSETPDETFQAAPETEGKVAESVFIAGLFVLAAREMAAIAEQRGAAKEAQEYRRLAGEMEAAVLEHGWDGAWYLRAYDRFGRKVGSQECEEGKIYVEPQGMCVLAGIGLQDGKAGAALTAVNERLSTAHGILLQQPAYTRYDPYLGEITSYPPGYKENGGVFCHTNPWVMIAEAKVGNGDRAYDYYLRINPSRRETISELHRCEPFVYAQMIAGRDAAAHGEAKNSWLTGTASWNYVAITQWILGIRPAYAGLQIAPVIPRAWPGFTATRRFRGVLYHVRARRLGRGNQVSLTVDGEPVRGDVVRFPPGGRREVWVEVTLR